MWETSEISLLPLHLPDSQSTALAVLSSVCNREVCWPAKKGECGPMNNRHAMLSVALGLKKTGIVKFSIGSGGPRAISNCPGRSSTQNAGRTSRHVLST